MLHCGPASLARPGLLSFLAGVFCHRQYTWDHGGPARRGDTVTVGPRPLSLPRVPVASVMNVAPGVGPVLAPALPRPCGEPAAEVVVPAVVVQRPGAEWPLPLGGAL